MGVLAIKKEDFSTSFFSTVFNSTKNIARNDEVKESKILLNMTLQLKRIKDVSYFYNID